MGTRRRSREATLNLDFGQVVQRRRMVRNFVETPVAPEIVDDMLALALRSPSAGYSQGTHFLVLTGDDVVGFWSITLPEADRSEFPWPGLLKAPVIVLPLADEAAYRKRYSEPDKRHTGLGDGDWPIAYWQIDTAMATMTLLHAVVDAGLGALFFALFRGEQEVLEAFGVPHGIRPIGAVAIGHRADGGRKSTSLARNRRDFDDVVHRGGW